MRKRLCVTAAVAAVAALAGCGGGQRYHYSESTIGEFTSGCVSTAVNNVSADRAESYCGCVVEQLEQHVSYERFAAAYARSAAAGGYPSSWQKYLDHCADEAADA